MQPGRPLVIVPCGATKQPLGWRGPASGLYIGPYFRSCLRAALALAPPDRCRILSGYYGLLRLSDSVEPYEMRVTAQGAIAPARVAAQAREQGLDSEPYVICLTGRDYAHVLAHVWPHAHFPLSGSIFDQMSYLRKVRLAGSLV